MLLAATVGPWLLQPFGEKTSGGRVSIFLPLLFLSECFLFFLFLLFKQRKILENNCQLLLWIYLCHFLSYSLLPHFTALLNVNDKYYTGNIKTSRSQLQHVFCKHSWLKINHANGSLIKNNHNYLSFGLASTTGRKLTAITNFDLDNKNWLHLAICTCNFKASFPSSLLCF